MKIVYFTLFLMFSQGQAVFLKGSELRMRSNITGKMGETQAPKRGESEEKWVLEWSDLLPNLNKGSDETCLRGLPNDGHTACCSPLCWVCSNTEECNSASTSQGHKDNCCPDIIKMEDKTCDENMPPCKTSPDYTMQWRREQSLAIDEARHQRHLARVKQREFRALLFYKCKVKYDFALDLAMNVKMLANALVVEANRKIAEYQSKLNKKPDGPNDAMWKFQWENELESYQDEARFYGEIERNAAWVAGNATQGLVNVDTMKVNIQIDIERIETYRVKVNDCLTNSVRIYNEAELLWQQWLDSSKTYNCTLPNVNHHEAMCKTLTTKDKKCNVKCEVGFDGEGTRNSLRCIKQGEFGKQLYGELTGVATCLGRSCGMPPAIAHASVISQEVRYPNSALYTCEAGHTMDGLATGEKMFGLECGYQGVASAGIFVREQHHKCMPVSCGKVPDVKNSVSSSVEYFFSEVAEIKCLDGYTIDGFASGDKAFTVGCLSNGAFTSTHTCMPVRCGPIPYTSDSKLITKASGDQFFPDELRFACDDGFSLNQKPTGPKDFTLKCTTSGEFEWTESPGVSKPRCRRISAGMSPMIPHGLYHRREMFFGEFVVVVAETGYSTKSLPDEGLSFVLSVDARGEYAGLQQFKPVSCGPKPDVSYGSTGFKKPEASYGDIFTYTCEPGYSWDATKAKAARAFTIRCEADASFSKIPGRGGCVNIDDCLSHTCGPFGYCVDELMNYTCQCDSGFQVTRDNATDELTCGNIDDCGPEACGVGKCIDGINDYSCKCPSGYTQEMDAEEKTCVANICGVPPEVGNALTKPIEAGTSKISFPSSVTYQCATGFTLEGKAGGHNHFEIECNADKSFSATHTCKPNACDSTPDYDHSSKTSSSAVFGESVAYTCDHGYTIDGSAEGDKEFHIGCHATGQYGDGFPCLPIKCGEPGEIGNAGRPSGTRYFGDVVTYTCFDGFSVDGNKKSATTFTAECGVHGHFEVSGEHSCHPVMCGKPTVDLHVLHASAPEKDVFYPQVAQITCRDGFTVKGDPNGAQSFTIKCQADGEFEDYNPHSCEAVKCGLVPPMANATLRFVKDMETNLKVSTKLLQYNMKAIYDCLPGFTAGGSEDASSEVHAECFANGEYSFPQPSLICRNVNDCAHHTCGPFGQCIDEIGPAPAYNCKCDLGYKVTTKATGEKHCGQIDDCKGHDCGSGVCKDLINDYTCICPMGHYIAEENGAKTCRPFRCADKAPVAGNATLVESSKVDKPFDFPHSLRYQCLDGFSLDGTASESAREFQASCEDHGEVSGLVSCQAIKCGVPHAFARTHLMNLATNYRMVFGEKAEYECDEGCTIGGSVGDGKKFEVECQKTGVMSDPETCQPVQCGNAPEVKNGHPVLAGHILYGMSLQYVCEQGYTLSGVTETVSSFTISCGADAEFTALPSSVPCKAVSAGKTPVIPNAYLSMYSGEEVDVDFVEAYYPHAIEWKCKEGYTDSGGPAGKTKFLVHVNSHGEFEPPPPTECKLVTFTVAGEIKNARNGQGLDGGEAELVGTGQKVVASNGFFSLQNVPKGTISIKYTRDGYITNTRELQITGDVNSGGVADINMSPKMKTDQWRSTIKWGPYPRDLDTYVKWGWSKVWWSGKYAQASSLTGRLEHDDTNGYGPETAYMTGVGKCNGDAYSCDMKYMINDYTRTHKMGENEAEVTLYHGDGVAGTWKIGDCESSVSDDQLWWHVFTIDGKTNRIKWDCHQGASSSVHLISLGNNESQVDFDSYVGAFPGRYFRHSRHPRHSKAIPSAAVNATAPKSVGRVTLLSKTRRKL